MKCSVKYVLHKYYICTLSFISECRLSCFQGRLLSERWYNYTSYKMDATWSIFGWYFYIKNWCLVITNFVLYICVTVLFSQYDTVLDVWRACLSVGHLAFCYGKWCHSATCHILGVVTRRLWILWRVGGASTPQVTAQNQCMVSWHSVGTLLQMSVPTLAP